MNIKDILMIWDALKALFFALIAYIAYKFAILYKRQRQLEAQGVVFNPYFPIISDTILIIYYATKHPSEKVGHLLLRHVGSDVQQG